MTTTHTDQKVMFCTEHGRVDARLVRRDHPYGTSLVRNALAYVCPVCDATLAFPSSSSGRIAQAARERDPARRREFRVPVEVEDQALAVHAAMGTLGAGEDFTLPLRLGLQVAGRERAPKESWKRFDAGPSGARARPLLTASAEQRLEGLRKTWGARSVAQVVRWLVVAAAEAVRAGLSYEHNAPGVVLDLCTPSIQSEPSEPVMIRHKTNTTPVPAVATSADYSDAQVA